MRSIMMLVSFRFQETLGFDGRHAARAGGGDGLAVDAVLHVAGVENARDVGARAALGKNVAVGSVSICPLKTLVLGMWPMARKKPSTSWSQISPVLRLRRRTPVTSCCETS